MNRLIYIGPDDHSFRDHYHLVYGEVLFVDNSLLSIYIDSGFFKREDVGGK